jgi:hypothetical protein
MELSGTLRSRRALMAVFVTALAVTTLVGIPAGGAGWAQATRPAAAAFTGVLTFHNDNARDGVNSRETMLTPANVNSAQFGKVFSFPVDGYVYAQPLYVPRVKIPGNGVHNVVYVATEHDSVYAFDAEGLVSTPLWQRSFINPAKGITTVPSSDTKSGDIVPEVGITSTPVIDPTSGILYVVALTKVVNATTHGVSYQQTLHALALTTGAERLGGPRLIDPLMRGTGAGSYDGQIPFNALSQGQRAGLLLSKGVIYIAFASHGDNPPYHGLVIAYGAAHLGRLAVFDDTPDGSDGGIWQSGNGPAADAQGRIYVASGNGTFDLSPDHRGLGDSIIELSFSRLFGFSVKTYFTPYDQADLSTTDLDFGDSGVLLLPDQPTAPVHLAVSAGKDGVIYMVNRDKMGGYNPSNNDQIVQALSGALAGGVWAVPAFFYNTMYLGSAEDFLKGFTLSSGQFPSTATMQTPVTFSFPGTSPSISANSSLDAIVWTLNNGGYASGSPTVLYAFDTNLNELYDSTQASNNGDQAGGAVKFTVPTIANGRVYVGTETELDVYGLLPG